MAQPQANYKPQEWLQPDAPKLKGEQLQAAVATQIVSYPQVVRSMIDPPLPGQTRGTLSYMLFDQPKTTKNGRPIYGFVKLRGNWPDEFNAKREASKIVKEIDSKFSIRIATVGEWVPITDDDTFAKEMLDVKASDQQPQIRDEAMKKKESDQRDKMRQIQDREEQLKTKGDVYDNPDSLDYYTMKVVTEMKVTEMLEQLENRLNHLKGKAVEVRDELFELEKKHPEYEDKWLDCYNAERAKTGIPAFVPNKEQFKDYEQHKLDRSKK